MRLAGAVLAFALGCHARRARACEPSKSSPSEGVTVERTDACLTLVRVDPARFRFKILTALADGGPRPAPQWAKDFQLAGVINASMFSPDQRSIGRLEGPGEENNPHKNPKLGGWMGFGDDGSVAFGGDDCPLAGEHASIVQDYRLLDCDGKPIAWKDPKTYSAAAIGMDSAGDVVLIHARKAYAMSDFAKLLPPLGIVRALYVEGGPEASLYWTGAVAEVGSFETGFMDDSNHAFWPIPNVIGVIPLSDKR